ncbi:unnamed protein product, partial [Brenthis ino]
MALMKSSNIPKDAVILDETEAIGYIWDVISKWDPWTDTWALRHGPVVLGAMSSISSLLINKHYRFKFKLGNFGYVASSFPLAVMPGILTLLFHKYLVSTDIVLLKSNCPICYEIKSAGIQMLFGIGYPMVLAPTSALMFANRYATFRVPHLKEGPKVMFQFMRKHTRSFTGTLGFIVLAQLTASAAITYFEIRNNIVIRHKMMELEKSLENKGEM